MTKARADTAFTVGFVLFIALGVLVSVLFVVGSGQDILSRRVRFVAHLPTTSGLITGSRVYLSGVPVGSVEQIDFSDDLSVNKVRVTLAVSARFGPRVRQDSTMWLATEGLLGDYAVHISMGTEGKASLPSGSEIRFEGRTLLEGMAGTELTSNTAALMQTMIVILHEIQSGQGTLGQLLKNPELYDNLNGLVSSIRTVSSDVEIVTRQARVLFDKINSEDSIVGKVLLSPKYATQISLLISDSAQAAGALKETLEALRDGEGTAGKLLHDKGLHDRLLSAVEKVERLSSLGGDLLAEASSEGLIGVALRDEETGQNFARALAEIEVGSRSLTKILALLERGEGTAGVLLHDPSIAISLRNLFLGIQDLGYVRGLVETAEAIGQEVARNDRLPRGARSETDEIGRIVTGAGSESGGATVPSTGRDEEPPTENDTERQ